MGLGGRKYNIIGDSGTKTYAAQSSSSIMTSLVQQNQDAYTGAASAVFPSMVFSSNSTAAPGFAVYTKNRNSPYPGYLKTHGLTSPDNFTYDANICSAARFSNTGNYLLVCSAGATFVYKTNRLTNGPFTAISPTGGIGGGKTASWGGPNDEYFAVATGGVDGLYIYKRTDDTFAAITSPSTSGLAVYAAEFDPTGTYLTVGMGISAPYVYIFKRSGDTFNILSNPTTSGGSTRGIRWAPDSSFFVVNTSFPTSYVYTRSGDTFTRGLSVAPAGTPGTSYYNASLSIGKKGSDYYIGYSFGLTSPYPQIYKYVPGTSFALYSTLSGPPVGGSSFYSSCITPDANYFYAVSTGTPWQSPGFAVYQVAETTSTLISTATSNVGLYNTVGALTYNVLAISPF